MMQKNMKQLPSVQIEVDEMGITLGQKTQDSFQGHTDGFNMCFIFTYDPIAGGRDQGGGRGRARLKA